MFSIPGILGLLFLTYIRPQGFIEELKGVPLVHIVYLTTLIGFLLDLRLRIIKPKLTPLLGWALGYMLWCLITMVLRAPHALGSGLSQAFICLALFFVTAHGVQSFRGFRVVISTLVALALLLASLGIYQGLSQKGCIMYRSGPHGTWDGRPCDDLLECFEDPEPGAVYGCEHVGAFGTTSINQRVRWIGIIQDPNELAMCVSMCIPLLIGLYLLDPTRKKALLFGVSGAAIVLCTVFTQSRGGQLVFLAAVGVYFVRRYGVRGALACAVMGLPVVLLGGRSGNEADLSKLERIEALYVAASLLMSYPLTGCGYQQFTEHNTLTAHNSYALAGAELGLPGLFIFVMLFYIVGKTFVLAAKRYPPIGPSRVAHIWAGALVAAQCGLMIGVFLLSFNTHPILWTYFGFCGSFYLAVQRHDPTFKVRIGLLDLALVSVASGAIASFIIVYSRFKMAGH